MVRHFEMKFIFTVSILLTFHLLFNLFSIYSFSCPIWMTISSVLYPIFIQLYQFNTVDISLCWSSFFLLLSLTILLSFPHPLVSVSQLYFLSQIQFHPLICFHGFIDISIYRTIQVCISFLTFHGLQTWVLMASLTFSPNCLISTESSTWSSVTCQYLLSHTINMLFVTKSCRIYLPNISVSPLCNVSTCCPQRSSF
jgi:hypothetical protein